MGVDHREMPQPWLEIDSIGSIDATDRGAARPRHAESGSSTGPNKLRLQKR